MKDQLFSSNMLLSSMSNPSSFLKFIKIHFFVFSDDVHFEKKVYIFSNVQLQQGVTFDWNHRETQILKQFCLEYCQQYNRTFWRIWNENCSNITKNIVLTGRKLKKIYIFIFQISLEINFVLILLDFQELHNYLQKCVLKALGVAIDR